MSALLSKFGVARWRWMLLALLLPVLAPVPASAAWWQTDWSYRRQITIDTTPKGANIADPAGRVPVLIRLHSGNFNFGDAQETGADLRFIGADDKTPLTYHIELFDPLLGVATIWVDVPDFPAGSAKQIWLYYANKKAPAAGDAAQTFDADYALVYHFDQAAGTAPKDATAYANNALTAPSGIDEGAIIGKGARFRAPVRSPCRRARRSHSPREARSRSAPGSRPTRRKRAADFIRGATARRRLSSD